MEVLSSWHEAPAVLHQTVNSLFAYSWHGMVLPRYSVCSCRGYHCLISIFDLKVSLGGGLPHPSLNELKGMKLAIGNAPEVTVSSKDVTVATAFVPTYGFEPLRQWILHYMLKEHQYPHGEDAWQFIIGNGSQDILQRLFDLLLDPQDTLLVEEYTYSGALACMWPVGCSIVPVGGDSDGLRPDALEQLLSNWDQSKPFPKALYTIPVAQNPTGTTLPNERKRKIYELAQKFDFVLIEDDPYWNLNFVKADKEGPRMSFWSMDIDQRVVRLESLSKITAVGYRVGWCCAPPLVVEKLGFDLEAGAQSGSGVAQLIVYEMVRHLFTPTSSTSWEAHVKKICDTYHERWLLLDGALKKHLKDMAEWDAPSGGMFAWVKLHGVEDTAPFMMLLAEHHLVLTVPGSAFTPDSSAPSPYLRLSYSYCDPELIEPAIEKLAAALKEYTKQ